MKTHRKSNRGMMLAVILILLSILLILGFGFAGLGTVNLGFASRDANKERAYQAAEAGLSNATVLLIATGAVPTGGGSAVPTFGTNPVTTTTTFALPSSPQQDYATVTYYDNSANTLGAMVAPVNLSIPPGTVYVISQGFACSGGSPTSSAQVGALFSVNTNNPQSYSVQAANITFNPSAGALALAGWDSAQSSTPTNNAPVGAPLLATNSTQIGAVTVQTVTVEGQGQVLIPHGAPNQVVAQNAGQGVGIGYLTGPMNFAQGNPETLLTGVPDSFNLNPPPGSYGTVTISTPTTLAAGSYTMNSLIINPGGSLSTSTGGGTVTLIIEGSWTLPPASGSSPAPVTLFNPGNPPNCFNVTYLGSTNVSVSLAASSPLVLSAPHANLTINSVDSTLGGAWFAQNLQFNQLSLSPTTIFCDLNYNVPSPTQANSGNQATESSQGTQSSGIPQVQFLNKQRY